MNDPSRPATAAGGHATTRAWMAREETIAKTSISGKLTIADLLKRDIQQSAAWPRRIFEAGVRSPVPVDKYRMVRFDNVGDSVPRQMAFKVATAQVFINHLGMIQNDKLIAAHVRSCDNGSEILDPLHYLATLTRRPGALDHSNVYRGWQLPECFAGLRICLE